MRYIITLPRMFPYHSSKLHRYGLTYMTGHIGASYSFALELVIIRKRRR